MKIVVNTNVDVNIDLYLNFRDATILLSACGDIDTDLTDAEASRGELEQMVDRGFLMEQEGPRRYSMVPDGARPVGALMFAAGVTNWGSELGIVYVGLL